MDISTFKAFKTCEAEALAKWKGEWSEEETTALLVGNYVHSYFESKDSHEAFIEAHKKEMISSRGKTKGQLKSDYKVANSMISTLENDQAFQNIYMPGDKEVIVTGKIAGHDWKGKIDSLNLKEKTFYDLKTVDDIHKSHYDRDEGSRVNFVKDRGYYYQIAMYRELIRQTFGVDCTPFIFAVSKQKPYPDHEALDFNSIKDQDWLEEAMQDILTRQDHYFDLIEGKVKPKRCGKCAYCRATKQISGWVHAAEIEV